MAKLIINLIGLVCLLQFFVIAAINIMRGYSIQSFLPFQIFLAGYLVLMISNCISFIGQVKAGSSHTKNIKKRLLLALLPILFIIAIIPGIYHRSSIDATNLYNAGYYNEALAAAEEITDTWYLRIGNNNTEPAAWDIIARVNCQKGDFDKAIKIYEMVIDHYPDSIFAGHATYYIETMQNALDTVSYYPHRLSELYYKGSKHHELPEVSIPQVYQEYFALLSVASAYQYGLNCDMKALEMCQIAAGLDIPEENKLLAQDMISKFKIQK